MSSFIRIREGEYRNNKVANTVFQLVEQYKTTAKGGFVTVKNGDRFPNCPEDVRIKVEGPSSYEFVTDADFDGVVSIEAVATQSKETDEEAIARIRERFEILDEMKITGTWPYSLQEPSMGEVESVREKEKELLAEN